MQCRELRIADLANRPCDGLFPALGDLLLRGKVSDRGSQDTLVWLQR